MPPTDDSSRLTISQEQAIAIRESVRLKLLHDYHSHLLIAHYYQVVGNSARAKIARSRAVLMFGGVGRPDALRNVVAVMPKA